MSEGFDRRRPSVDARYILSVAAVAVAYILFAEIGFSLAFETKQVSAVWPPAGIAIAALLLGGYRLWPGIWIGAFVSNALSHEPALTAAGIAIGNTLGPLLGVYILRRFGVVDNALERLRDVVGFVLLCVLPAMIVTASNGVLNLYLAGIVSAPHLASNWWVWWAGDNMGAILVAPLIMTWATRNRLSQPDGKLFEGIVLAVALLTAASLAYFSRLQGAFPIYPFVIWAAIRFRQRGTTLAVAAVSLIAIWATAHGLGPFGSGPFDERFVHLMTWMGAMTITGLLLSAVTAERQSAQRELGRALAHTSRVAETLREALLPEQLPRRNDIRFDALHITADQESLVGGDWYDAFELPDGRIVVSVGDVTGHGLDAAVTAARIRQGIFATTFDTPDPATILAKVNRILQIQDGAIATALVAIMERDLSAMRYASAGHPPPILASPTGEARFLSYGSAPLGIGYSLHVENQTVALDTGAAIAFYTDGITEFRRDIAGAERDLLGAVARLVSDDHVPHPAATVLGAVMGNHTLSDDVVLVVLQLSPAGSGAGAAGEPMLRKAWSFHSNDPSSAHASRHELIGFMQRFPVSDEDLFRAELILGEVLANTVEHAPGLVNIEIDWSAAQPVVTIVDSGPGLNALKAALPKDQLAEHGRGLYLISSLAQDVRLESPCGRGTRMRVVLPMSRATQPPRDTASA
jgi:integral membrane sensor domain MASE1/anti-sigma regulatory factor (Ser/Thr protein kinase)